MENERPGKTSLYFVYLLLLWGFLYIGKWFDKKKKSSMMEHEALPYDLVIEGRRFVQPYLSHPTLGRFLRS